MESMTREFTNWMDDQVISYELTPKQVRELVIRFVSLGLGSIEWGRKYCKEYGIK